MTASPFLATPRAGRSLEGMVAPLRAHVIAAAAIGGVDAGWVASASGHDLISEPDDARPRWALVCVILIDMVRTGLPPDVRRALSWFGADATVGEANRIEDALAPLQGRPDLSELLPYLLDTFGRTSRLDVMRDASLGLSRAARKLAGSFYTPSDVAGFMVSSIASPAGDPDRDEEWWVDPACGSGVFLLSALNQHRADREAAALFATTRLKGCDVSRQACDFAAFVVLNAIAATVREPFEAWRAIRRNIVAVDAVAASQDRARPLRALIAGGSGPMKLVCNPPYTSVAGCGANHPQSHPTKALYLPFVEMAWKVADGARDAAALVVPLALAANRSADHRRCRVGMGSAGGRWSLMFFDRQPHALFGEDAKTRATIAIRRPGPTPTTFRTTGLQKWTSRQRRSILDEGRTTEIGRVDIGRIIPKLGSDAEVGLYRALEPFRLRTGWRPDPTKASSAKIVGSVLGTDVFVAGTAYNFLNVFRSYPDHLSWRGLLSNSAIHRLSCASVEEADTLTGLLCSRATFWLWHVECDGFHVPSWFLKELPILNLKLPQAQAAEMARLGRLAWEGLQEDVLCSVNGGRSTFAFRPTGIAAIRSEIDRLLLAAVGAKIGPEVLVEFERKVVSIDGKVRLAASPTTQGKKR